MPYNDGLIVAVSDEGIPIGVEARDHYFAKKDKKVNEQECQKL
jgi:hypothetical protein